jgi:hypothetical protein
MKNADVSSVFVFSSLIFMEIIASLLTGLGRPRFVLRKLIEMKPVETLNLSLHH